MKHSLILLLALTVAMVGCTTGPFAKKGPEPLPGVDPQQPAPAVADTEAPMLSPGLAMAPGQRFPDVPLPADVKEDLERSYVYEAPGIQLGRMVYSTRNRLNDLAQFYIRECPTFEWKLETVLQAEGYELFFKKPGKKLTVSIRNLGLTRGRLLILNLTPEESPAQ